MPRLGGRGQTVVTFGSGEQLGEDGQADWKVLHLNSSLGDAADLPTKADVALNEARGNLGRCLESGELRRGLRSHTRRAWHAIRCGNRSTEEDELYPLQPSTWLHFHQGVKNNHFKFGNH